MFGSSKLMTWRDAVDVDAARGDIRSDQHAMRPGAKFREHPLAGVLRFVAVNRVRCDAGAGEDIRRPCRRRAWYG